MPGPVLLHSRPNRQVGVQGPAPGNILSAGQTFFWVIYQNDGEADHPFPNLGEKLTAGGESGCRSSFGDGRDEAARILMRS